MYDSSLREVKIPFVDTPFVDTPSVDTPSVDTPSVDTPSVDGADDRVVDAGGGFVAKLVAI